MRFKAIIYVALVLSIFGNVIFWFKMERHRAMLKINNTTITKFDYHYWLHAHYGVAAETELVKYNLIKQASEAAKVAPSQDEIDKRYKDVLDSQPAIARDVKFNPWKEGDYKQKIESEMAMANLCIKDVKLTDDEVQSYFKENVASGRWDTPDRIYAKVMVCANQETADRCKELMGKISELQLIQTQLRPNAGMLGNDGTLLRAKPVGGKSPDPLINAIANLKPNEVATFSTPKGILVVRLDHIDAGMKATFADAKDKVERDLKLSRQTPPMEMLRKLWNEATIWTDGDDEKKMIELRIFQDQATTNQPTTGK